MRQSKEITCLTHVRQLKNSHDLSNLSQFLVSVGMSSTSFELSLLRVPAIAIHNESNMFGYRSAFNYVDSESLDPRQLCLLE